jgi:molybdopterin molybdotransferase
MNGNRFEHAGYDRLSVDEALARLLMDVAALREVESIETERALGRVLAECQVSRIDVPATECSATDGFAVAAADLNGSTTTRLAVHQRVGVGDDPAPLRTASAAAVVLGAPLPAGADAVLARDGVQLDAHGRIVVSERVIGGQNIRRVGEDIGFGTQVLAKGTRLRPQELGVAATVGLARLPVYRRLRVGMLSAGADITAPGEFLRSGRVYNSNRYTIAGLLQSLGCSVLHYGSVRDDRNLMRRLLVRAAEETDLVITSGGVPADPGGFVERIVGEIGRVRLWHVAIEPGKVLLFGRIGGTPLLGLPGNPLAAFVTSCVLVRPYVLRSQGISDITPHSIRLAADFEWPHPVAQREYLRAQLCTPEGAPNCVRLHPNKDTSTFVSTLWADGLVDIPAGETIAPGQTVTFVPFAELFS